jgi:hypothetical protein
MRHVPCTVHGANRPRWPHKENIVRRARRHRNGKHAATWKSAAFAGAAAAASLAFGARDSEAAVFCDLGAARQYQVQTSARKSYVGLQPCFETGNKIIRPLVKWTNKRGGLGCSVSIYPPGVGCSVDAWKPEVDFHDINLSFYLNGAAGSRSYNCPPDVGDVNAHNDYEFTCYSSNWYSTLGEYRTNAYTEFDVKDDGNAWFSFWSGTMTRNNK